MAASATALMTAEEFARLNTPETENAELVEGEVVQLASGTPGHAASRDSIAGELYAYSKARPIARYFAEVDCLLDAHTIRRPDISVFLTRPDRIVRNDVVPVPFAPDIAVEVLSPSEGAIALNRKVDQYLAAGTQEVWLVDRENRHVCIHAGHGVRVLRASDTLETPLLPGFSVPIATLLE